MFNRGLFFMCRLHFFFYRCGVFSGGKLWCTVYLHEVGSERQVEHDLEHIRGAYFPTIHI